MQARFIAQLIVSGAQTIGRAFTQALRQEYQGEWVRVEAHRHEFHTPSPMQLQWRPDKLLRQRAETGQRQSETTPTQE